ncbi:MAG: type II toxin-antitoxin system RelE/ParE family toxin [Gammaproteobacteria bacterium]|nr:type II toxin-antitoxin system RelE/ParE family toxin [Gammaproteobacteria bacterium]
MTKEIRLREEAEADLEEASVWYQQQRRGLGYEFLDEVVTLLHSIQQNPVAYPIVHRNTRPALTKRFPFGAFYRVESEHIVIVAIMHASRHPSRWKVRT